MTFNALYKNLLKNISNRNYVAELLEDPKDRYQEALFVLFSALNLNDKINVSVGNFKICLDGFNTGGVAGLSLIELRDHNIKGGGSASDCTFIKQNSDEDWEMICISAKDFKAVIGVKGFETSDIYINLNAHYQAFPIRRVGIITQDKDKISIPHKSSHEYQKIIDQTLIFDNSDLDRWWREKFCPRSSTLQRELGRLTLETFKLRLHQDFTVEKTKALIKASPEQSVLWGHIPRSGKSFMIAALIRDYVLETAEETRLFAIVCAIPNETKPQYKNIFKSYLGFKKINIVNVKSSVETQLKKGKNVLLFSRQFFTNKQERNKLNWIKNKTFEYLFVDEAHFAGTTELSDSIFKYYFSKATRIYVTATFRKPEIRYEISKDRIIIWRQEDIKLCKNLDKKSARAQLINFHDYQGGNFFAETLTKFNAEENYSAIKKDYDKFPELELITWRIGDDYKQYLVDQKDSKRKQGWSIRALFNKNKIGDGFENQSGIIDVFSRIFGTCSQQNEPSSFLNRCYRISKTINKRKHPYELTEKTIRWFDLHDPKLILCYLPMHIRNVFGIKKLGHNLKKLLEKNNVCPDFYIQCINSTDNKSAKNAVDWTTRKVKNQKKYKGILLLLGRQLQMGVSLPKADFVLMLDNAEQFDSVYQKMFRCLTEDNEKHVGFCIDLNIHRIISLANTEMWHAQDAEELGADKKQHRSYKFDERRFSTRLININSDQYTNRGNLQINQQELKSMVDKMNKLYVGQILSATSRLSDTNSVLSSFYRKNEQFVRAGEDSLLLQDMNNNFTTTPRNTSVSSSDIDTPSGLNVEKLDTKEDVVENLILSSEEYEKIKKNKRAKINYARDIFPPLVILMCILTIRKDKLDNLQNMSDYIKDRYEYKEYLLSQINLWWKKFIRTQFNGNPPYTDLVQLYHKHFYDDTFNKWIICYKARLVELHQVDKQQELSKLIDETFKPSQYEKNNFAAIMTPRELRQKMLDLMPSEFWKSPSNTVFEPCCGKGGFVVDIIERFMTGLADIIPDKIKRYQHIVEKQIYFADIIEINIWLTRMMLDPSGNSYKLNYSLGDSAKLSIYHKWGIKNFDAIITNPPFNDASGNHGSGHEVWPQLIEKFVEWLKNYSGLLLTVCPNKWRHINSLPSVNKVRTIIKGCYLHKITFCDVQDGLKYFNCSTMFDYFLLQKIKRYKTTKVTDTRGQKYEINLSKFYAIPNFRIIQYYNLLDFVGGHQNNKINYIYSGGSYHKTTKTKIIMSKGSKPLLSYIKTTDYKYTVISTLNKEKKDGVLYTNDNSLKTWNGKSFLVPKVIFTQGSGLEKAIIDFKGEFLLTQFAYAVGDHNIENLYKIQAAIRSKEFKEFTESLSSSFSMNCQIFKYLKKDFYKYFNKLDTDKSEE